MSFNIFVVTYRVTNFLPKLVHMLLFSTEKTDFYFFHFPIFGCCLDSHSAVLSPSSDWLASSKLVSSPRKFGAETKAAKWAEPEVPGSILTFFDDD